MKITDASQFDRLFKALALELTYANVHYNMFLKVNASITEYQYEVNQAPAFWGITRDAIKDVATLGICRVYDSDHRTNSLPNLLIEMRDNPAFLEIVLGKECEGRRGRFQATSRRYRVRQRKKSGRLQTDPMEKRHFRSQECSASGE